MKNNKNVNVNLTKLKKDGEYLIKENNKSIGTKNNEFKITISINEINKIDEAIKDIKNNLKKRIDL